MFEDSSKIMVTSKSRGVPQFKFSKKKFGRIRRPTPARRPLVMGLIRRPTANEQFDIAF